ncbi:MAG: hypothetical protein U5J95_10435 [Balneolaceae bacterium]|nr:hypothetical protein [Balneolaceae bacterium]
MEEIVAIVTVFSFSAFVCFGIYKLIKMKIQKSNAGYDDDTFERLAKAFMKYKKESEKRIQNLEAIVSDDSSSGTKQIEEPKETIEIEDSQQEGAKEDDGNLRNMLRE